MGTADFKIELGSEVQDKVTGFKGVVIGRTEWHYGCRRYTVQPKGLTKEGKTFDTACFDEDALKVTKRPAKAKTVKDTGGPQPSPARPRSVKRS